MANARDKIGKELEALLAQKRFLDAAKLCREAVGKRPGDPELWRLSGIVALHAADPKGALACFEEAVKLAPKSAPARSALASALLRTGERARAVEELEKTLELDPKRERDADSLVVALLKDGSVGKAREALKKALALGLKCPDACALMASVEIDEGDGDAAAKLMTLAARWSGKALEAIENCAVKLIEKGDFKGASLVLKPAVEAQPGRADLHTNLGLCLMQLGRFDEAFAEYAEAKRIAPSDPAFLINYGTALYKTSRLDEAIAVFERTLKEDPSLYHAELALALAELKTGRLKEGFLHWESRLKQPDLAKLARCKLPLWTTSAPRTARVLIHCEQGFGDSVFFARFLPALRSRCARVVFACRKELTALFEGFPGIDELVEQDEKDESFHGCEFRLPMASLPLHFLGAVDEIAKFPAPKFKVSQERLERWRRFVAENTPEGARRKVGICWSGSQANRPGRMRSIPAKKLAPLFEIPGIAWFSLQADKAEEELKDARVVKLSGAVKDFADTAALIEQLDATVSIDTAVAHLAGCQGKTLKLALCSEADWRWFEDPKKSPWLPSAELFRQKRWGDWSEPLAGIAEALKA